jgi:uncharacterized membrane protein YbhN (UPF0104 family)
MDRRRVIMKGLWRGLFMAAVWIAAAYALRYALRGLDWPVFRAHLVTLDWRWVGLAVAFDITSYVAQGVRWRLLLAGASVWQTTRAIYAGLFINELVPFRPGEAIRAWLAARDLRVTVWNVLPTMVTERVIDGIWLAVASLAALAVAPLPHIVVSAVRILIPAIALLVPAVLVFGRFNSRMQSAVLGLRNPKVVAISGCFLVSQGFAFWATGRASHLPLNLLAAFVVMLVVRLGTLLPGAPANLGAHQLSTVLGLSLYGVSKPDAASFSVIVFAVLTMPLCLVGLLASLSSGLTLHTIKQPIEP